MLPESNLRIWFLFEQDVESLSQNVTGALESRDHISYVDMGDGNIMLSGDLTGCDLYIEDGDVLGISAGTHVLFTIQCEYVCDDGEEVLLDALDLVTLLYKTLSPGYVFGMHISRVDKVEAPYSSVTKPIECESLSKNRITHPTWLMVFPPAMVEEYGREWLLDLPADRIEELDDGAIMVVATEDITSCEADAEIAELMHDAMEPIEDAFDAHDP